MLLFIRRKYSFTFCGISYIYVQVCDEIERYPRRESGSKGEWSQRCSGGNRLAVCARWYESRATLSLVIADQVVYNLTRGAPRCCLTRRRTSTQTFICSLFTCETTKLKILTVAIWKFLFLHPEIFKKYFFKFYFDGWIDKNIEKKFKFFL